MRSVILLEAAILVFLTVPVRAADSPLPPIEYQSLLGLNPGNDTTFTVVGGAGVTVIDCQPTVDCLRATLTPDSASMFEYGFSNETSNLRATVTWFWEVEGPAANGIPIDITYDNTYDFEGVDQATSWQVSAAINETNNASGLGDTAFCSSIFFPSCSQSTLTGSLSSSFFSANVPYELSLTVAGQIVSGPNGGTYLSATADPVISFGPGFDSTGYSIVLSDGEPNGAPPVPEPSTAMLIVPGVLCLLAGRRFLHRVH